MSTAAKRTRANRTITVDFRDEATYFQLLGNGKAFVEFVCAFLLSLGLQLAHKATCRGGGCLTRHSHYARARLGGLTIWRIQCTTCRAVFTVLPHFVLRYRPMRPEVARDALLATHGGLSLERCAVLYPPLAHGPLSLDLRPGPPEFGDGADPVRAAAAGLCPGRRKAQQVPHRTGLSAHHRQWPGALASGLQCVPKRGGVHRVLR